VLWGVAGEVVSPSGTAGEVVSSSGPPLVHGGPMRPFGISSAVQGAISFIEALSGVWLTGTLERDLVQTVTDIVSTDSKEVAMLEAERFADGFVIPQIAIDRDENDLAAAGSIEALILSRQNTTRSSRFNEERCQQWFADDVEFDKLMLLAREGAIIDVSDDFVPSNFPGPDRPILQSLKHILQWHAFDLYSKGQALLLSVDSAVAAGVHFNPVHWTPKPGKPEGRFLCDLSNAEAGSVINEESAKPAIDTRYGPVELPSIQFVVDKILDAADMYGGLENIRIWKEDIVGAFNQFSFSPSAAKWLSFKVGENTVLILFTGVFGWMGSPAVWAVFSRALLRAAEGRLHGLIVVYVDDFIGISSVFNADRDQANLRSIVVGVFGQEAINTTKSVLPSPIADTIGWTVDLPRGCIYPNEKGRRKLVSAFFGFDLKDRVHQKTLQRMASLASRYSLALIGTRPFVRALHAAAARTAPMHLSSEVKACIVVWRAIALMALSDPISLAVPLSWVSSRLVEPDFEVTSDAGPLALGLVVYLPNTFAIIGFLSYTFPYMVKDNDDVQVKDSKFQNIREFLGVVMAMLVCHQLAKGKTCHIHWRNDNVSALAWVSNNVSKSKAAQLAFLLYTWVTLLTGCRVSMVTHIPGITMGYVDKLSRHMPTPELVNCVDWSKQLPIQALDKLFLGCDPIFANESRLDSWANSVSSIIIIISKCLSESWDL
jgi:hypothetical protein